MLKLIDGIEFEELKKYGFIEDPANCEHPEDTYYWLNCWYYEDPKGNFRIVIYTGDRSIAILCLPQEKELNVFRKLEPLYNLIFNNMVEIKGEK